MEITKKQLDKFNRLKKSGLINMTDIVKGAKMIKETEEVYEEIMFNYQTLKDKLK